MRTQISNITFKKEKKQHKFKPILSLSKYLRATYRVLGDSSPVIS
jgi:hypothetical protein